MRKSKTKRRNEERAQLLERMESQREWEVREAEQKKLLEGIRQEFDTLERSLGVGLYQCLVLLLCAHLSEDVLQRELPSKGAAWVVTSFGAISTRIREFQRSEEEGAYLFSELLKWTADKIAWPHYEKFRLYEKRKFYS